MKFYTVLIILLYSFAIKAEPLLVMINGSHKFDETVGKVDLHSSTTNFTEIELDQTSSQNTDLAAILETSVGLQIQQSGGLGSYSSVSLRAASSEQVNVYLDGILLNDSVSGQVDLSLIPINQIQRIEIFRGSTPIELGSASMGGAINIITRENSNETNLIGIGISSHQAKQGNIHWSSSDKNNYYRFVSEIIDNKNKYPITNDNGTTYVTDDDRIENRNNAEIVQDSLLFTWKRLLNNKNTLINSFRYFDKEQNLPNFNNSSEATASFNTELFQFNSKLSLDTLFSKNTQFSSELYIRNKEEIYDDRKSQIGLRKNHMLLENQSLGLKSYIKNKLNQSSEFRLVLDLNHQNSLSEDLLEVLNDVSHKRNTATLNIGLRKYLNNGKSVFNVILAHEYINDELDDAYDYFDNPVPSQNRKYTFNDFRLGYSHHLSDNTKLKFNLGMYHRAPYLYELYGDRGFFHGNEDLKAESSINFDAGLDYYHESTKSFLHGTRLYLGFFQNKSKDLIIREYTSQGVGVPENIDNALIRGIESNISWPFYKNHQIKLNVTLLDPIIESDDPLYNNNIIPGQFLESYSLSYRYLKYSWFVKFDYIIKNDMFYERLNLPGNQASDREIFNAKLKRIYGNHNFIFSIKNILDNTYEDYNGYPKPGKTTHLSYTYEF